MFLVSLLILVGLGFAIYTLIHRHPSTVRVGGTHAAVPLQPLWPTTTYGRMGIGAFVLVLVNKALVNVVQVPFVGWLLLLAALALSAWARLVEHDRSMAVLVVFIVTAIGSAAAVLFLAGHMFGWE